MNTAKCNFSQAPDLRSEATAAHVVARPGRTVALSRQALQLLGRLAVRLLRGESRPPSVLRNNTNLPMFLAGALALSLLCNFALRQSSAQASRYQAPASTTSEVLQLLRENPDNPVLHSQLGELYLQQREFKRAMFHLREASRLSHFADE